MGKKKAGRKSKSVYGDLGLDKVFDSAVKVTEIQATTSIASQLIGKIKF